MQVPCMLGGYVQEGRGGPVGSSHATRHADIICDVSTVCCDKMWSVATVRWRWIYRFLGGGLGFGVPVVSYAPRPMIMSVSVDSRVIIMERCEDCAAGGQNIMSQGARMAECKSHKG